MQAGDITNDRSYPVFMLYVWPDVIMELDSAILEYTGKPTTIQNDRTAHLIAYIPYIAGSSCFMQAAILNLAFYANTKHYIFSQYRIDQAIRFKMYAYDHFYFDGDRNIKYAGKLLTGLSFISDYRKDSYIDLLQKQKNPLITKTTTILKKMERQLWREFNRLAAWKNWDFDFFINDIRKS